MYAKLNMKNNIEHKVLLKGCRGGEFISSIANQVNSIIT